MLSKTQSIPEGYVVKKRYSNGQLAVFFHNYNSEPIAELSIPHNSVELAANEIILKDYSENSKIAQHLIDYEFLIPTDRFVLIGSHLCPVCRVAI